MVISDYSLTFSVWFDHLGTAVGPYSAAKWARAFPGLTRFATLRFTTVAGSRPI